MKSRDPLPHTGRNFRLCERVKVAIQCRSQSYVFCLHSIKKHSLKTLLQINRSMTSSRGVPLIPVEVISLSRHVAAAWAAGQDPRDFRSFIKWFDAWGSEANGMDINDSLSVDVWLLCCAHYDETNQRILIPAPVHVTRDCRNLIPRDDDAM